MELMETTLPQPQMVPGIRFAVTQVLDPAGRATEFQVDADGNLTSITDPDASQRQFAYDDQHRMVGQLSKRAFATSNDYGFAGQFLGAGFPDGASIATKISRDLGLADLGIGLGTEASAGPRTRWPNLPTDAGTLRG